MSKSDESNAAEAPAQQNSETNLRQGIGPVLGQSATFGLANRTTKAAAYGPDKIAKVLLQRGISSQPSKNERFRNLARILLDLEAKKESQLYGGSR